MPEWPRKALAEVANVLMGQSPPGSTYNSDALGLPFLQGSAEFGDHHPNPVKWCSAPAKTAEPGDLMISVRAPVGDTNFADQRLAIGRGLAVVRGKEGVLTEYLRLVIQAGTADLLKRSGSGMFASITAANLRGVEIPLPSVPEQRRIVDLIGALDDLIAACRVERRCLISALERLAFGLLSAFDSATVDCAPLDRVFSRNIGGLWGDSSGAVGTEIAVFRSTEFTDLGYLSGPADAQRFLASRHFESRALAAGDILVEKSGGTPSRPVGRVVRVAESDLVERAIGANFLQLLRVDPKRACSDYIFWLLWASHRRGDAADYQQASTNIRNLRTKAYLGRPCALPSIEEQRPMAEALDATLRSLRCNEAEERSLTRLRQSLLDGLLSRSLEIPESYDTLLAEVV